MNNLNDRNLSSNLSKNVRGVLYVERKHRDIVLPMTLVRRPDMVLEPTKFRSQIPTFVEADAKGFLTEKFLDFSISEGPFEDMLVGGH